MNVFKLTPSIQDEMLFADPVARGDGGIRQGSVRVVVAEQYSRK